MIPEIIAGIGLGKLSEDIVNSNNSDRQEIEDREDDTVDWCPEMDWNEDQNY